jgi:hypothetical protein
MKEKFRTEIYFYNKALIELFISAISVNGSLNKPTLKQAMLNLLHF